MINGKRLSISTGSLDRLEMLERTLPTWLAASEPDEIVVVDWCNAMPLRESLRRFSDPRLVIVRAIDQPYWLAAKCHNLELQTITGEVLLRLDNDVLLGKNFFTHHPLEPGSFYAGNWRTAPTYNEVGLTGTLYVHTTDLFAVNGYNERLTSFGYDDDDLYDRLVASGLRRIDVDFETLEHVEHDFPKSYEHLKIAADLPRLKDTSAYQDLATWCWKNQDTPEYRDLATWCSKDQPADLALAGRQEKTYLTQESRKLSLNKPWTTRDRTTAWRTTQITRQDLECVEIASLGTTTFNNDVSFVAEDKDASPELTSAPTTQNVNSDLL
jgi:hypothetical protein